MRTFRLERVIDESGVSGTGIVAQGVEFDDGSCALRWLTKHRSTAVYDSATTLEKIHGHGGKTLVVYDRESPRFEKLLSAAYSVTTDAAQDQLEDPIGAFQLKPYCRIHEAAMNALNDAIKSVDAAPAEPSLRTREPGE